MGTAAAAVDSGSSNFAARAAFDANNRYSQAVRAKLKLDLQSQQKKVKERIKAIEKAGNKKIKRGRR